MTPEIQHPPGAALGASIVAAVAPMLGSQHATIVLAALAGAMWACAARPTATRMQAAMLVLRLVLTSSVLAGLVGWWLETKVGIPVQYAPTAAAWAIAAVGDGWRDLIRIGVDRLRGAAKGGSNAL